MSTAWRNLGGKRRTLARQVYARDSNTPGYVCPRCRRPIDWSLVWPHPKSRSVDHVDETQDGGALLDVDNLGAMHLSCNSSKGAARRHQREREQRQTPRSSTSTIMVDPTTL